METHNKTREIILVILALLIVAGGSAYLGMNAERQMSDKEASNVVIVNHEITPTVATTTVYANTALTDEQVVAAINKNQPSTAQYKFQLERGSGYMYVQDGADTKGGMNSSINTIFKGDLNGDGYADAVVTTTSCGASCGQGITVVLNQKDGTGKEIDNLVSPPNLVLVGAGQIFIKNIEIKNGIISITIQDPTDGRTAVQPSYVRNFNFQNNTFVEVK